MPDTIAALLSFGQRSLASRCENARLDAELLLANALGVGRSTLYGHPESLVPDEKRKNFLALVDRRAEGEPLAYLTGEKEFWSLSMKVSPATLIPRPESELIVDVALERAPPNARIADLGTGSGAIAIAIAKEHPDAALIATDASEAALEIARVNAKTHGTDNVEFRLAAMGDWFSVIEDQFFNLIVANPPYVCSDDPGFEKGGIRFEPRTALASGHDGMDALRQIITNAAARLDPGGWLLVEHGNKQGRAVRQLFSTSGFTSIETRRDLANHDRVTLGQLSPSSA